MQGTSSGAFHGEKEDMEDVTDLLRKNGVNAWIYLRSSTTTVMKGLNSDEVMLVF